MSRRSQTRFSALPLELATFTMEVLLKTPESSPADLLASYNVKQLRFAVLCSLVDYCRASFQLVLCPTRHRIDLLFLMANFGTIFDRTSARKYMCLPESFFSTTFSKGIRGATVSFLELWVDVMQKTKTFSGHFENRNARREKQRECKEMRDSRVSERSWFVDSLLRQNGLFSLPRTEKKLIESFISSMPRLRDDVVSAIVVHRENVFSFRSPESYFLADRRAARPRFIFCSQWTGEWIFCQTYGDPFRHLAIAAFSDSAFRILFQVPFKSSSLIDMKCNELGDIVLLYNGPPWLVVYDQAGLTVVQIDRHFSSHFHSPTSLSVGKSGMMYINDPKTMHIQRICPDGMPISALRCRHKAYSMCLDSKENVCVVAEKENFISVYNWNCDIVASIEIGGCRVDNIFCDSRGFWYIVDYFSFNTKVFEPCGSSRPIAVLNGFSGASLCAIDNLDRMSFFNGAYFCIDSFKKFTLPC